MKSLLIFSSFVCKLLVSGLVYAAEIGFAFFPNGRSLNIAYSVPFAPVDPKQCAELSLRIEKVKGQISEAHSECLKAHPGGGNSTYLGKDPCSSPACQSLHTSGNDISERGEVAECYRQVDSRSKSPATSDAGDFSDEIRALARGPKSAVKSWVRDKMARSIADVFGTHGISVKAAKTGLGAQSGIARVSDKDAKLALAVVGGTAKLYSTTNALHKACRSEGASVADVCQGEIQQSVQNLSSMVPNQIRSDPAVRLIQSAMLERLASIQRQTTASLSDALTKAGDGEFKVIDSEQFPNQSPSVGTTVVKIDEGLRAAESQVLIQSRKDNERRMIDQAERQQSENVARAEQRAQERQQVEIQRQMLESMTSSRSRSRSPDTRKAAECWSAESVCSGTDSKCIAESRERRARLTRCKGG